MTALLTVIGIIGFVVLLFLLPRFVVFVVFGFLFSFHLGESITPDPLWWLLFGPMAFIGLIVDGVILHEVME